MDSRDAHIDPDRASKQKGPCPQKPESQGFQRLVSRLETLPAVPQVIQHIVKMAEDMDSSIGDLAAEIRKDSVCAAKILKLANSAFFSFSCKVSSIQKAVILIGFDQTKQIAVSIMAFDLFLNKPDVDRKLVRDLWAHSLSVAMLSEFIAGKLNLDSSEECYSAGLFHDIGKLVMIAYLPHTYQPLVESSTKEKTPMFGVETSTYETNHAEIGGWLLNEWKFPESLVNSVAEHHGGEDGENIPAEVVLLADYVSHQAGFGIGSGPNHLSTSLLGITKHIDGSELIKSCLDKVERERDKILCVRDILG